VQENSHEDARSMLVTLSLLAGIAAPASAFDGKSFWTEQNEATY
jgi:hypothetical protein